MLIAGKQKLDDFPSMSEMGNVSDLKQRGTFAELEFFASAHQMESNLDQQLTNNSELKRKHIGENPFKSF